MTISGSEVSTEGLLPASAGHSLQLHLFTTSPGKAVCPNIFELTTGMTENVPSGSM
jgi:hypothetical protein